MNHIEAAFVALGRSIVAGIRATRQDYALTPDAEEATTDE